MTRYKCFGYTLAFGLIAAATSAQAVPLTFTLDPSRSQLTLSTIDLSPIGDVAIPGSIPFFDILSFGQGPGSLVTSYSGTFDADLDLASGMISSGISSDIVAANSGTWRAEGTDPTSIVSGPANYGHEIAIGPDILGGPPVTVTTAIFDFSFLFRIFETNLQGISLPISPNLPVGETMTFSSRFPIRATGGTVVTGATFESNIFGDFSFLDLSGEDNTSDSDIDGTLISLGGGDFEIVIPVSVEALYGSDDGFPSPGLIRPVSIGFTGVLVARTTIPVPEPGTLTLASFALAFLPLALWRSRRMRSS